MDVYSTQSDFLPYHFVRRSVGKILKPRHYGAERPALLYLATRLCPVSFDSQKIF